MKDNFLIIFRRRGWILFIITLLFLPAYQVYAYLSVRNFLSDSIFTLIFLTFAAQFGWLSTLIITQSVFGGEYGAFIYNFLTPQPLYKILFQKVIFSLILQLISSLPALIMVFFIDILDNYRYFFISQAVLAFFISPFNTIFNSLLNPYPLHTIWLKGMSYEGFFKKSLFGVFFLIIGPTTTLFFKIFNENIKLWFCVLALLIIILSGLMLKMKREFILLFYKKRFVMMERLRPLN